MNAGTRSWPTGHPVWVDISVTDIERSKAFYTAVLGWDYEEGAEQFGGYTNALVNGGRVAGVAPPMPGMDEPPHVWTTYLVTPDVAADVERATTAGADLLFGPDVMGPFGTMAYLQDPAGAAFGLWQPDSHPGYAARMEPGTVAWSEPIVRDVQTGKDFYTTLFGYRYTEIGTPETPYGLVSLSDNPEDAFGGIAAAEPGGLAPQWFTTFAVTDVDAAADEVRASGGSVVEEPYTMEYGRFARCQGPDGEEFGLMAPLEAS